MDKLRKVLAVFFGALSVFFAYKALVKSDVEEKQESLTSIWGDQSIARKFDKPIFFAVKGKLPNLEKVDEIIKEQFVFSLLDPLLNPADLRVLQMAYETSGLKGDIYCGVLTPKMFPIILCDKLEDFDSYNSPSLNTVLLGAAKSYKDNKKDFEKAKKMLFSDLKAEQNIPMPNNETASVFAFLMSPENINAKSAQNSECAKLAFRIYFTKNHLPFAMQSAALAKNRIFNIFSDKSLHFMDKALYAKAIGELAILSNDENAKAIFINFADKALACQDKDGKFIINGNFSILENAAAINIMAMAYKLNGESKYAKSFEDATAFFGRAISCNFPIKSQITKGSYSGAKEYAMLASAFLNSYIANGNTKNLERCLSTIAKADKYHLGDFGMLKELCKESSLAKNMNAYSLLDDKLPSSNGLLLQVLTDLNNIKNDLALADRIKLMYSQMIINSFPISKNTNFSTRLAKYPNPMMLQKLIRLKDQKVANM